MVIFLFCCCCMCVRVLLFFRDVMVKGCYDAAQAEAKRQDKSCKNQRKRGRERGVEKGLRSEDDSAGVLSAYNQVFHFHVMLLSPLPLSHARTGEMQKSVN